MCILQSTSLEARLYWNEWITGGFRKRLVHTPSMSSFRRNCRKVGYSLPLNTYALPGLALYNRIMAVSLRL